MTSKPPQQYPSPYRFYTGSVGLGIAVGISWTIFMTGNYAQRVITKSHAIELLFAVVALFFGCQLWMLVRWDRDLKKRNAELAAQWAKFEKFESEGFRWTPPT